jgi:hypothetical protein
MISEVMRRYHTQNDATHASARSFRNRLIIIALLCLLVAAALVVMQWRLPNVAIFSLPKHSGGLSRWAMTLLILAFGSVGALVSAIPAMSAIPQLNTPYNYPLPQGIVKIVFGSLTALVGVIVIGSSGVTNGLSSMQSLAGVALAFGAGQQTITRFLDKRAVELTTSLNPTT